MSAFKIGRPGSGGGGTSGFDKAAHEEHLLAFVQPTGEQVSTSYGEADAARCPYVLCLDCSSVYADVLLFGTVLAPRLLDTDDDVVAGRLARGQAKPGRSAPWLLEDPLESDLDAVAAFFDKYAVRMPSGKIIVEQPPRSSEPPF